MVKLDVGDDAGERSDDVGGIKASAEAGFPDDQIDLLLSEIAECHDRHDFKKSWMRLGCELSKQLAQFAGQTRNIPLTDQLAIDLNAFAKGNQVRRGKEADLQP